MKAMNDKPKLLLADRNDAALSRLAKALSADGCAVTLAHDLDEARATAARGAPDLVVCAENLPKGGGYTLLRRLKADDPSLGGVLILARDGEKARRQAKRNGADLVLVRPVSGKELAASVRAMRLVCDLRNKLDQRAPQALEPAAAPDSIFDPYTGFYTFDHFKKMLFVEVKRSRRYGFPIALMLAAYDPKRALGSDPALLRQLGGGVALAVRRSTRDTDYPVAFHDRNVLVLMPHTELAGAEVVARRILFKIARSTFQAKGKSFKPTIAIGLSAATTPQTAFSDLVREASQALKKAMERGGNCVVQGRAA